MGLGPLIREYNCGKDVDVEFLRNKILAVDALVTIYQMLATIRGSDGYFLVDSKGRITSHLVGIFNRECRLLSSGIRSIYIFDGPPHPLKMKVLAMRKSEKKKFYGEFLSAVRRGDVEAAIKLGKRAMFIDEAIINSTKKLLDLLGIPYIQAPHDAEAQAAYVVNNSYAFAVTTRDWDSILYGAERIIMHWKITFDDYLRSRLYRLDEILSKLGLNREQLIDLALLLGTDFNPGGFPGIGPKTAYRLIKKYGNLENLIQYKKVVWRWEAPPDAIRKIFVDPPVNKNFRIEFKKPDKDGLIEFLVNEHDFSKKRVLNQIDLAIKGAARIGKQKNIDDFFSTP